MRLPRLTRMLFLHCPQGHGRMPWNWRGLYGWENIGSARSRRMGSNQSLANKRVKTADDLGHWTRVRGTIYPRLSIAFQESY